MVGVCGDEFLNQLQAKYKFLKDLPLCKIYETFEKPKENISGYDLCHGLIESKYTQAEVIRPICQNVNVLLKELNKTIQIDDFNNASKGCDYLNYWLRHKIKDVKRPCENISNLYTSVTLFSNSYSLSDHCKNVNDIDITNDQFEEKKQLYYYTEIFQWIRKKYNALPTDDQSLCGKYFDECSKFYNDLVTNNYCEKRKVYASELDEFQKEYKECKSFLSSQKKAISIKDLNPTAQYNCHTEQMDSKEGPQEREDVDHGDGSSNDNSNGVNTVVIPVIMTMIGIFLLLLLLHKFTPFGPWARHQLRKKDKIWNNIYEKAQNLLRNPRNENISFSNSKFNIKYNSVRNE
ncbi:PIR Superfamily Protein [Plasmodium ovale curtisi]|uniref:PIR Superfamily Protein n=1 Tax=Plasmodium ovale curtisi TaxID=864141 RepID=A0A1A8X7Q1_PLAOA|nr:PIR Superfamily Protein [Plasmodium ovale curtisi]